MILETQALPAPQVKQELNVILVHPVLKVILELVVKKETPVILDRLDLKVILVMHSHIKISHRSNLRD